MKKYLRMSSAAVVIGALRVKLSAGKENALRMFSCVNLFVILCSVNKQTFGCIIISVHVNLMVA